MSFTAKEYRIAARVAKADGDAELIAAAGDWSDEAERLEAVSAYSDALGMVGVADLPQLRGAKLLTKLSDDGWTAPEGLL